MAQEALVIRLQRQEESFQAGPSVGRGFFHAAGDFDSAQTVDVSRNSPIERLGDALAVVGALKALLVTWIADKRDFRKDRRHIRADEDNEGRFLHSAIADA